MGQVAYYFAAAVQLGAPGRPVSFAVPTGNFGNVFSGYVARRMGLPIHRLIVGTNRNNVVERFLHSGELKAGAVVPTITPAMDIQVPSNLERLLFDLHDGDAGAVEALMAGFAERGSMKVEDRRLATLRETMSGIWLSDDATRETIGSVYRESGLLVDPHTAVGVAAAAASRLEADVPVVCLGTAHPAKFPQAVEEATGVRPPLPERLADLAGRRERFAVLPADPAALEDHVRGLVG